MKYAGFSWSNDENQTLNSTQMRARKQTKKQQQKTITREPTTATYITGCIYTQSQK